MPILRQKVTPNIPRFGDIFNVELDPVIGSEIGKQRPALVVSNNINNELSNTVTILPVTSSPIKKRYPFEVFVPKGIGGLTEDSRIKANQIRTVDKMRLKEYRGSVPVDTLSLVETALRVHLNMKTPRVASNQSVTEALLVAS
jgi:mRNA interferase MazF